MAYQNEFLTAIEFANHHQIYNPEFFYEDEVILTDEALNKIPFFIRDTFGDIKIEQIIGQCFGVHCRLIPPLQDHLNRKLYFTIGYVEYSPTSFAYKHDQNHLVNLLRHGIEKTKLSLHAWITLPSLEILDFSLPSTIGKVEGNKKLEGAILSGHADRLKAGVKYHPTIVGTDFLRKIGAMIDIYGF